jgi:hypothetical protein
MEITGGWDIDISLLFGRALKGYAGVRGELGGEGRITGSAQTDKCNGVDDYETIVCGQFRARGTIRVGFSLRFTTPTWSYEVATGEAFLAGNVSYKVCIKISTEGGIQFHSYELGKFEGTYGYRVCALGTCYTQSYSL